MSRVRVIVALLVVALSLVGLIPLGIGAREAWASHCTLSGGTVTQLADLSSRPNNDLSCNTANSRSDGATAFPGFSPYLLFRAASGNFGRNAGGGQLFTGEFFSVTMASFVNLNPGDITGGMFGDITLFSTDFNKAPNVGPFMTDVALQSILVPCGVNTGDGVTTIGGQAVGNDADCPNASGTANTSGVFTMNPAMTITSFATGPGGAGAVASFQQQMNNIATGNDTEGFVFNSRTARLFDFGSGAAVSCTITGTLRSTCARQGFTQFVGGALQSTVGEAANDAQGTSGSRVTIEAAFAVTTLASGLHSFADVGFRIAWHQLISQGDFQMDTLGSFRANSPAFMPAASYPTGLSLSSSSNFLLSQVAAPSLTTGVIFLTRTPGNALDAPPGNALNSTYSITYRPSHCLPGFLTSTEIPVDVRSTAFNGAFLFRGAFNDFACPAPP